MSNYGNPMIIEDENSQDEKIKEEIDEKLSIMKKNDFCTTNFKIIEMFAENDFKPFNIEDLTTKLLNDYNENPNKFILTNCKGSIKSEKNLKNSINMSISRNKAFIRGPKLGQLSLNLEKTNQYLNTMFKKYTTNSKNVTTPIKIPKNNKLSGKQSYIKDTKKKDNIHEYFGMEIEEPQNNIELIGKIKSEVKDTNNKNNNSSQSTRNDLDEIKIENDNENKKEKVKENNNNEIIPISNNNSNPKCENKENIKKNKENEKKNENKTINPEIFFNIYHSITIFSLDNKKINNTIDSFNKYLKDVKSKKMNNKIEEELEKISKYLQEINKFKKDYNKKCDETKICQKELNRIYKSMIYQLNAIKLEIINKYYSFEVYCQIRELFYKYEKYYNDIIESFLIKLEDLKGNENQIIEISRNIQERLNYIHHTIGFRDFVFSRLTKEIKHVLKINDLIKLDIHLSEKDNCEKPEEIVNNFKDVKKNVVDDMNTIDQMVRNIKIY